MIENVNDDAAVIHVCESLASGILRVVPPIANATAAAGIPTVVVHGRRPETPRDLGEWFDHDVRLVEVPGWGDRSLRGSWGGATQAAAVLRAELAHFGGGVLHLHSSHAGFVGRLVSAPGWRRFYTPQGYAFLNGSHGLPFRLLTLGAELALARRAHTVACSRAEGDVAGRLARGRPVTVVQNGIEPKPQNGNAPSNGDEFVVASVGRAVYQRRPDLFVELRRLLRDEGGTSFYWFGDGPERARLSNGGVTVSGWLDQDGAAAAIARTDVLVHFSAFEGLPLSLLEGMTAGRAVVATDLSEIREVVADAGILVRSAPEAAAAVRRLRADDSYRGELAARARERASRLFTQQAMVERMLATYGF
jgi:glycosyltransferase involved in cell wall biosynthesis